MAQLTEKYNHLSTEYAQLKAEHAQQKAEYAQQKADHEQLREMVMSMASQSGDTCSPHPFWLYNKRRIMNTFILICNKYYLPLIVFLKHISVCNEYYLTLFFFAFDV